MAMTQAVVLLDTSAVNAHSLCVRVSSTMYIDRKLHPAVPGKELLQVLCCSGAVLCKSSARGMQKHGSHNSQT